MNERSLVRPALYVVATPIGNLEDITLRALRVLKQADLIACEDTRHTRQLLNHFAITTPTISYHEHNERGRAGELVAQMLQGRAIALVSDAGMPAISDPGYRVVAQAIENNVPVIPVPGVAAFVAALAASGLPTDEFEFHGFLPAKPSQRRKTLEGIRASARTVIFYEAPHRLRECMADVVDVLGAERPVVIARELTKLHEEFLRGRAAAVLSQLQGREIKGEITLLIGRAAEGEEAQPSSVSPGQRLREIMQQQNVDEKAALKILAKEMNVSKSEAYRRVQASR